MNTLFKLENSIQNYAWGSHTALAELLGQPTPSDQPQAELWMGAHPKAPSMVSCDGRPRSLASLVRQNPLAVLGRAVLDRFGPRLPFLFKVLAVAQPLSIQAHPSKQAAEQGFKKENAQGIDLGAPHRNYRDDQHKPECVCALTPFQALCGFRPPAEVHSIFDPVWPPDHRQALDLLDACGEGKGMRPLFEYLMTLHAENRRALVAHVSQAAQGLKHQNPAYEWMVRLNTVYPNDVGVLSPGLLNLLNLNPGQALFLPSGQLHAYLSGVSIELMANSDNVLRGGLTPKHVDVAELLRVLDFHDDPAAPLAAEQIRPHEQRYPSDADEFELSVIDLPPGAVYTGEPCAPEILLCTDGSARFQWDGAALDLRKGESLLAPCAVAAYTVQGPARLYKATVNRRIL